MPLSGIFSGFKISASGMHAQRIRQNAISSNLANAETTRTDKGGPYRRQFVVFKADAEQRDVRLLNVEPELEGTTTNASHLAVPPDKFTSDERYFGNGVNVAEIREDSRPPRLVYDPGHPDANGEGYVEMPNINTIEEMTDMIAATRAYEANVTAFNALKSMYMQGMQI